MSFIYNNQEVLIIDSLGEERNGFVELEFLKIIDGLVNHNSTIVDVGCNIGNHTIFFSKVMKCKKVFSFEPIPDLYQRMLSNFKMNDISNVVHFNMALSSKTSMLRCISKLPNNYGSYWLWYDGEEFKHPYDQGYSVHKGCDGSSYVDLIKSTTLDSIIDDVLVDLIKIDVEGMEMEVLLGGINTITINKPMMHIEVSVDNIQKIINFMKPLGYRRIKKETFDNSNQLWCYGEN